MTERTTPRALDEAASAAESGTFGLPGAWPTGTPRPQGATDAADAVRLRVQAARARRDIVLGSIRAELAEQPSPRAVRAAGRRWCAVITQLADQLATGRGSA